MAPTDPEPGVQHEAQVTIQEIVDRLASTHPGRTRMSSGPPWHRPSPTPAFPSSRRSGSATPRPRSPRAGRW